MSADAPTDPGFTPTQRKMIARYIDARVAEAVKAGQADALKAQDKRLITPRLLFALIPTIAALAAPFLASRGVHLDAAQVEELRQQLQHVGE